MACATVLIPILSYRLRQKRQFDDGCTQEDNGQSGGLLHIELLTGVSSDEIGELVCYDHARGVSKKLRRVTAARAGNYRDRFLGVLSTRN